MDEQNKQDNVLVNLVSQLQPVSDKVTRYGWKRVLGFRKGIEVHSVWYHVEHGYTYHVGKSDDDLVERGGNMGIHDSFQEMLDYVSYRFASRGGL